MACSKGLLTTVFILSALRVTLADETRYTLLDKTKVGAVLEVSADLQVTGNVQVKAGGNKAVALPLSVKGTFRYSEKRLADASKVEQLRSIRYYRSAEAQIDVDKQKSTPKLRQQTRLMVAHGQPTGPMFFSPGGPLTREELDLLKLPGDSLLVPLLLPSGPVEIGAAWNPPGETTQALVGLDVVGLNEVTCTLAEVKEAVAKVELSGKMTGGVDGAETEITLDGYFLFDLDLGYIKQLEFVQKEKRSVGHVAPGLDVEARVVLSQNPAQDPRELSDDVLSAIPLEPNPAVIQLAFESPDGKLRFYYDRQWHVFFSSQRATVLRLIVRGEMVAQCNVSRMPAVRPGHHADPRRFGEDVIKALGNQFQRLVQAGEVPVKDGRWIYRLSAVGAAGKLPVQWIYYLVAGADGDQAVFVYTMEAKRADQFGARDLAMVGTVEFPKSSTPAGASQTAEKATPPAK